VRPGAEEAYVEGVFDEDGRDVVLARRVTAEGRTRAYVDHRSATVAELRERAEHLIAFYGQHEHRRLMLGAAQLEILDALGGPEQFALRARVAEVHATVRGIEARAAELRSLAGARDRELDLVAFELDEIDAVAPSESEESELTRERDRLHHLETLRLAAAGGAEAISPEADTGVVELLAGAVSPLEQAAAIDPQLAPLLERLQGLQFEAQDLAGELRGYLAGIEAAPGRLDDVQERLALFARLARKHGGSISEVLRHAERCRARREELADADSALEAAEAELATGRAELDRLAGELTERRRAGAAELSAAVRTRLAELAMPEARFDVALAPRVDGCGPRGADAVEFAIAPNAGLPAGPLREIASGGELSRVMLALLSVAHGGQAPDGRGEQPLLVFDEIDAGIGGHTARAVGEHLRGLARGRQILCITHLPQVAALGGRHFTIVKDSTALPARTTVTVLEGDAVVGELVRMLGAGDGDRAASQHARQLLRAA
jgi:DNA repair protein RecN (Recombination protein N)